eukprot:4460007-Heterocapsa_arctica.AAC.1
MEPQPASFWKPSPARRRSWLPFVQPVVYLPRFRPTNNCVADLSICICIRPLTYGPAAWRMPCPHHPKP